MSKIKDKDNTAYRNLYFGKKFSILGDSISTLEGYNPRGFSVFYAGENGVRAKVFQPEDTWWGKVIDSFNGELLVNNSWSGSRVTQLPDQEGLFPSGCSDERTSGLHSVLTKPDVIFVYLGTNDWARGVALGTVDYFGSDPMPLAQKFSPAYREMLKKIRGNYPDSEIWCCTLCTSFMSGCPEFVFPYTYAGIHIEEYNDVIRGAAISHGCKLIDLYRYKTPYDSIDGSHPNLEGMKTIAGMVRRSMAEKASTGRRGKWTKRIRKS